MYIEMEISMYFSALHMLRYMEISMYLNMSNAAGYMEISMYLSMCSAEIKDTWKFPCILTWVNCSRVHGNFQVP